MVLYTGGKYQGKLDLALSESGLKQDDCFDFSIISGDSDINMDEFLEKKVWYHIEEYVRYLVMSGKDALEVESIIKEYAKRYEPEVVIISEVGAGVIPINKMDNLFREITGSLSMFFAENSKEVYRVVCGLKVKIK